MSEREQPAETDEDETGPDQLVDEDGIAGVVLDQAEEALVKEREAEIPELDRLGLLRPIEEYLAESRKRSAERRIRRTG